MSRGRTHGRGPTLRSMRLLVLVLLVLAAGSAVTTAGSAAPEGTAAATCSDYDTQAEAQRAKDTRDADGDGVYCETLPCPCLKPSSGDDDTSQDCRSPNRIVRISFSRTKYPNIRRHFRRAVRRGWPKRLVLNRPGADARRDRLLEGYPTREGYDRDEYPPAVGRGRGKGLTRGRDPRGWKANVAYVPSSENRSHGSTMGIKLRRYCNGTRFRYVFY